MSLADTPSARSLIIDIDAFFALRRSRNCRLFSATYALDTPRRGQTETGGVPQMAAKVSYASLDDAIK